MSFLRALRVIVCMFVCLCLYLCDNVYINLCIYAHIHTHISLVLGSFGTFLLLLFFSNWANYIHIHRMILCSNRCAIWTMHIEIHNLMAKKHSLFSSLSSLHSMWYCTSHKYWCHSKLSLEDFKRDQMQQNLIEKNNDEDVCASRHSSKKQKALEKIA